MAEKVKDEVKQSHKRALREIELQKARVELAALKVDLEMDSHRLDNYRDEKKKKKNEDESLGIFSLESSVGTAAVVLSNTLRKWARAHPKKPITLNIFSPGGRVLEGLVLFDTLRTLSGQGHQITTHARGYAASMGSLIFLAGDTRLIGAEAMVMFHSLSAGTGGSLHDMEEDVAFFKRLNARLEGIITGRTKVTKKLLAEKTKKSDWWCDSGECLKLGVAHEVL